MITMDENGRDIANNEETSNIKLTCIENATDEYLIEFMRKNDIGRVISFKYTLDVSSNDTLLDIFEICSPGYPNIKYTDKLLSCRIWNALPAPVQTRCKYIILLDESDIDVSCDNEDYILALREKDSPTGNKRWYSPDELYLMVNTHINTINKPLITEIENIKSWASQQPSLKYVEVKFDDIFKRREVLKSVREIHPNALRYHVSDFVISTIIFKYVDSVCNLADKTVIMLQMSDIKLKYDDDAGDYYFSYLDGLFVKYGVVDMYMHVIDLIKEYNIRQDAIKLLNGTPHDQNNTATN